MLQDKSRGTIRGFSGGFKNRKEGRSALLLDGGKDQSEAGLAYSLTRIDSIEYIISCYHF
jgi:hypothetical protein